MAPLSGATRRRKAHAPLDGTHEHGADPREIVAQGYDRIAETYRRWSERVRAAERELYTRLILDALPPGARVLELGCGTGLPTTRRLAEKFRVTAIDLSPRHVALARVNVARILHRDMTRAEFPDTSFDAIVAFYSIVHVPRAEHDALLARAARWLAPGGLLVAAMGAAPAEAMWRDDWLGAPMYWSHFGAADNRALVERAGLTIERAREETEDEDGEPVTFLWIVARKDRH